MMRVPVKEAIVNIILKNCGQKKLFDEWFKIINSELPKPKRLTRASLCHLMIGLKHNNHFIMVRDAKPTYVFYSFELREKQL